MLPFMARSMSRSLGFFTARSRAVALITCPDWQKPHCGTSCATHAACTAFASRPATPSMVVTWAVPTADTGSVHERSGLPSSITVQAPHCATPQPYLVPVNPIASRRTQRSGVSPSTSTRCMPPFTLMVKAMATSGALCCVTNNNQAGVESMTRWEAGGASFSPSLYARRRAEHIMGMPVERLRRWTAREVRRLIADAPLATPRYELVDGELLVTPSPGPPHQMAVALLLRALGEYCDGHGLGPALPSPSDIELKPEDVRQPDVFVLPKAEWKRIAREGFPAHELLLAIEVLSPSSGRFDRVTKRVGYQAHVPEYWIVDIDARIIERWRPGDSRPEILSERLE